MKNEEMFRYRIFCPKSESKYLPSEITVEEKYPAFVIVLASEKVIEKIRKRFPVEKLKVPKPPPEVPTVAGLAKTMGKPKKRGPYTIVARFRAPTRKSWIKELKKTGCESQSAIGSSTVVVRCPNKKSLAKLESLPIISLVSTYIPTIQITAKFFKKLGVKPDESSIAEIVAKIGGTEKEPRASKDFSLPGILAASFFSEKERQQAKKSLLRQGIHAVTEAGKTKLIINLTSSNDPVKAVKTIVALSGLSRLEEKKIKQNYNDVSRKIIGDQVVTPHSGSLGLTGQNEIVAVADSGLDTGDATTVHVDFQGRVRDIQSFPIVPSLSPLLSNPEGDDGAADIYSGHGTHVCGSVLGNGARSLALGLDPIQGMAPEAELVFQAIDQTTKWNLQGIYFWLFEVGQQAPSHGLFGIPEDLKDLFQAAYDKNARIHSNSWGGGKPGEYDEQCADLDQFVWEHKDFLILVAAGNEGTDINPPGQGIDSMSVNSPGTAKNCLTIGACENNRPDSFTDKTYGSWWPSDFPNEPFKSDPMANVADDIVAFSSRGPCKTGRRKPDLIAPGTFVLSTRSSQIPTNNFAWEAFPPAKWDYMFMGGTSMATPLVAGCAALVRQYLRHTVGINNPTAALLKAALIHSAQYQPYRYANPASSAWADNEQGWGRVNLQKTLNPQPPINVLFFDETQGLQENSMQQFNIEVHDSQSPLRITMVYSDFPGEDLINNLNLIAYDPNGNYFVGNDFEGSGTPDSDNNVEGIVVENPEKGIWSIRVFASNIIQGPQDFALVVSGVASQHLT